VNVSVRIGSPGDDGPVSQSNATTVPTSTTPSAVREPAVDAGSADEEKRAPSIASRSEIDSSSWYWEWNCRDLPLVPVVSPNDSTSESMPRSWTWIWNCSGISDQYHSPTVPQYQQSNTNIAIRLSSPGNDGPVTQVNIAVPIGGSPVSGTGERPSVTVSTPAISIATPSVTVVVPSITASASVELPAAVVDPEAADPALEIEVDFGNHSSTASSTPAGDQPFAPTAPVESPTGAERAVISAGVLSGALGVRAVGIAAPAAAAAAGASRREPPKAEPVDTATGTDVPAPKPPTPPVSGASVSAAGAAGSSGGGLPIFLALPFIAAMLDLARRVALERATWPSGHRRRVPETPG
jgi:hypothetical protein